MLISLSYLAWSFKIIRSWTLPKVTDYFSCPLPCGRNFISFSLYSCITFLSILLYLFRIHVNIIVLHVLVYHPCHSIYVDLVINLYMFNRNIVDYFYFCVQQTPVLPRYHFQRYYHRSNVNVPPSALLYHMYVISHFIILLSVSL